MGTGAVLLRGEPTPRVAWRQSREVEGVPASL